MKKQEVKIEYFRDGKKIELFFFAHSLMTAREHAEQFIEKNRGKFAMRVYMLNNSCFGDKWVWIETIKEGSVKDVQV